jgi:glycosyltransferase involved in cell wall biosynthesis
VKKPMKKIRVLEMIDKPFLGGGQRTVLLLAENLDRKTFDVSVCSGAPGPLAGALERIGVRHFPAAFGRRLSLKPVRDIARILTENKIDILHTHGGVAGLYGRWAARRARRRARTPALVHTIHGIHYLHYRNPLVRWGYVLLEKYLSRTTDAVIFVSEADLASGNKHGLAPGTKMTVIKNGVDSASLRPARRPAVLRKSLGLRAGLTVVGTVARLHRQKGIPFLLRAAAQVHRSFPQTRFMIVGGGPWEKKLKSEAAHLGLARSVLFLGEREDATDLLSLFDVFVLPSLWEGLPYVLIEAAILAKPIVATDIDGVREVLRDGETGLLVPAADPASLALAVKLLLDDPALGRCLAGRAQRLIPKQFTIGRMIEETKRLYMNVAGGA